MFKLRIRFILFLFLVIFHGAPVFSRTAQNKTDSLKIEKFTGEKDADNEIIARQVQDQKVKEYQRQPDFAYANDSDYWKKDAPPEQPGWFLNMLLSGITRWIILILFLLVIAYGIYRLAKENSFPLMQRRRKKEPETGTAALPEYESIGDLDKAISRFTEEGDFRMAVRYMYIRLIRMAFEKNNIPFKSSSTNSEIVEAFPDPQQSRDFRLLATAYEYIFYGGFVPAREQFDVLQQKFSAFHQNWQD
ncbi:MAG: DUF4129 domain-containing protein [Chitinophagales bacterium]